MRVNFVQCKLAELYKVHHSLQKALQKKCSRKWCLTLWGRFIRARDLNRCVLCKSEEGINAHHIFRKTVLPMAEFQTGNGITLCKECHHRVHQVWNGRPLPFEPLNARGGDDQDYIASLYHELERDGKARGILTDDFYYLSDEVLVYFMSIQGVDCDIDSHGSRVGLAHLIWQNSSVYFYAALADILAEAHLLSMTPNDTLDYIVKNLKGTVH